mgnify:CR=1 FL=1
MKNDSKAVNGLLGKDSAMLAVFLLVVIGIAAFVMVQVLPIVESTGLKVLLLVICACATLVLGGAMASVMLHLRKRKDEVYGEELYYAELARKQKEGK